MFLRIRIAVSCIVVNLLVYINVHYLDVIGVVKEVGPVSALLSKASNKEVNLLHPPHTITFAYLQIPDHETRPHHCRHKRHFH